MSGHERYADLVAPYVLGALDEGEAAGLEAHLDTCRACRDELALLSVAADALPASVPQLEPPPALRDRVMAIVNREAELLAAAGPEADRPAVPARRPAWYRRVGFVGPLAGAVAAAALAVVVIGDGDMRTVEAAQAPAGSSVRIHVGEEHSTLVAEELPAPPQGRVYQVWIKRPGRAPEPTRALFAPGREGTVSVDVPGSLDGVEGVLVTDEPIGGSQAPTREPVIVLDPA